MSPTSKGNTLALAALRRFIIISSLWALARIQVWFKMVHMSLKFDLQESLGPHPRPEKVFNKVNLGSEGQVR